MVYVVLNFKDGVSRYDVFWNNNLPRMDMFKDKNNRLQRKKITVASTVLNALLIEYVELVSDYATTVAKVSAFLKYINVNKIISDRSCVSLNSIQKQSKIF